MRDIKITPIRIIPFDIGTQIDVDFARRAQEVFEKTSFEGEFLLEDRLIVIEETVGDICIRVDVFKDGVGIISFIDEPILFEKIDDFDVKAILRLRREVHNKTLKHEHPFSQAFDKIIKTLREIAQDHDPSSSPALIRFTASDKWEKKGLSYVMSIYLVYMPELPSILKNPKEKKLRRKFAAFLFPGIYGLENTFVSSKLQFIEQSFLLDESLLDKLVEQAVAEDHDLYGSVGAFVSWSNVVVVGDITENIIQDYRYLQIKLQHFWFYTYITDDVISDILEKFEEYIPRVTLDMITKLRTRIILKLDEFENVQESTMGTRFFRLFDGLIKSSKLDVMITRLEKKLDVLKERIEREQASRSERMQKRIELILFVVACVGSLDGIFSVYSVVQDPGLTALICLPIIVLAFFTYLILKIFMK